MQTKAELIQAITDLVPDTMSRKDVKARKERKGTNPFTGEPTVFKARPASKTAKVTALKKLKDAIGTKSR